MYIYVKEDVAIALACLFNDRLLSSMPQAQLYKASVASGLKNMSWAELSGSTISVADANLASDISESASGFGGVGAYTVVSGAASATTPGFQLIPTVGSVLVLTLQKSSSSLKTTMLLDRWDPSICKYR